MGMPTEAVRRIRKACLAKKLPLSRTLLQAGGGPKNAFLTNPSSQNVYVYLTHFVRRLSEAWFSKTADRLEVLDWGCGKGHVTLLLKEANMAVTACDVKAARNADRSRMASACLPWTKRMAPSS